MEASVEEVEATGAGVGRGYNLRIAIEMDWNNLLRKK